MFLGLLIVATPPCHAQVCGCTDPLATNYDAEATVNNGSCKYAQTTIKAESLGLLDSLMEGTSSLLFWNNGYWTFNDHYDQCLYFIDSSNANILNTLCVDGLISKITAFFSNWTVFLLLKSYST